MHTPSMRGYTLLEMIVSVGIFSIIMLFVTGAYLTLISLDREVRATTALMTNLSFAVDSMARSIRTGNAYGCADSGGDPNSPGTNCAGTNRFSYYDTQLNQKVTYIVKSDGTIGRCTGGTCSSATAISLTDPNVTIASNDLRFYVRGVGTSNTVQPQVTFVIRGTMIGSNNRSVDFSIQTSATQRRIDI